MSTDRLSLDRDGFVLRAAVLDQSTIDLLRQAIIAGVRAGSSSAAESGTLHVNLDAVPSSRSALAHPFVQAAARHVIGRPFELTGTHARGPQPGYGQQGLHADWLAKENHRDPNIGVTVLWLIDAFTHTNGATRVVPGTHGQARSLPKQYRPPWNRHPEEQVITAPAGSVLVFNAHLWHSGTRNDSAGDRWVVQQQFLALDRAHPIGANGSAS
jgi:ectoine hydroxylase-related dioxygenase (phytanoyl-CoA dioxygenase family)